MNSLSVFVNGIKRRVGAADDHDAIVDGKRISIAGRPGLNEVTDFLLCDRRYEIFVERNGEMSYRIWTKHRCYDIKIEDFRSDLFAGLRPRDSSGGRNALVVAPMPGMIARIEVKVGDTVEKGGGLLVLEAMKMENEIRAPFAGLVKKLHVRPGASVEKGEVLVSIEQHPQMQ
jgi:acetyl/propionyl-CoA carboxylase alpha subunit